MDLRRLLCLSAFAAPALLWAIDARAVSLAGAARGAVFIGRPLNITVAGSIGGGEPDSPCFDAEVFQGDARLDPARVSTRWEPGAGGKGVVRVTSGTAIEEPVLTIYLKVGCDSKVTRRYVVLAEQPVEPENTVAVAPRAVAPPAPARIAQPALRRAAAAPLQQRPAAPRVQSRLKLEPLDVPAPPDPALVAAREEAARARDEAARQAERIQALERDMRTLHDLTRRNVVALELMREQMEKARNERNTVAQVVLVLALLLAAVAVAWVWRSRRPAAGRAWWNGRRAATQSDEPSDFYEQMPPERARASMGPDVDVSFSDASIDIAAAPAQPGASCIAPSSATSRWSQSDFTGGNAAAARMLKAEELIDIQQQADFFQSIGDPDRAVGVLESHLQQQPHASPLVWLDLMDTYHELGRRQDYERVRAVFEERVNAQVAGFDAYGGRLSGLDGDGATLARIVDQWPSPGVLEVIEDALLRRPGSDDGEALDLEAYRELVLLYNVAKDLEEQDETMAAQLTHQRPAAAVSSPERPQRGDEATAPAPTLPPRHMPWPSPQLGLDIDLSGPAAQRPRASAPAPLAAATASKAEAELPMLDLDSLDARSLR